MQKLAVFCLLIFTLLPSPGWPQDHQVASQLAVSLAIRNPWPRLPTPGEITEAYNEYKSKLSKNVTITSEPGKMNAPWEKEPLSANKVVLTIRADYQSQPSQLMAVVLRYDFLSSRFKFQGVMLQGIKRYQGDKSTMSYLEPQDLVYLNKGWISWPDRTRKTASPDDVANVVEEYIRQFENTCFGQVVKLGDPAQYRQALGQNLTVISPSRELGKSSAASLKDFKTNWAITPPPNELHIPFEIPLAPSAGKLGYSQKQTLYHESTHHVEWHHGAKRDRTDPTAERNTGYLDELANALLAWQPWEKQLIEKGWSPEAQENYNDLEDAFLKAEKKYSPDIPQLESWAGIRIRIDEIRKHYLSRACGDALRQVVENQMRGTPGAQPMTKPANTGGTGTNVPHQPPAGKTAASHIVYAMIYDKETGRPLMGAAFTVLQPGVTTQEWISSDFDPSLVASQGVSDQSGMVVLSQNLEKGKTYSFMVARESYKAVRYETLGITETSPEPLKITIRLTR